MQYVRLGGTGLKVSRLCLGCLGFGTPKWMPWILDEEASRPVIAAALERGINFFDTADMYSLGVGEAVLGRALKDFTRRDEVVIASKVFFPHTNDPNEGGLSRKHIMKAIDRSLKNLGTDYVDLYQIHRFDYETPMEETLEALHDVVKAGKVRYIGASSMYTWQFAKMMAISERNGWTKFVSMQPQYNLMYREEEREMLPFCLSEGVGVIPWSPLGGGFLTGQYTREERSNSLRSQDNLAVGRGRYSSADYDVLEALVALAEKRGVAPAQVALAWMLTKPAITAPIVGISSVKRLDEALGALPITLDADEVTALEAPYRAKRAAGLGPAEVAGALTHHRSTIFDTSGEGLAG